jgi:hypothetical protein
MNADPQVAGEEDGGDGNASEKIQQFKVLSDRVVVATASGRVISIDLSNGSTAWQSRPTDAPVRNFQAIDDFVVVAATDPSTMSTDVVVLDGITGQIADRTTYSINMGRNPQQFMNMALSRDGVLVTTVHNQIIGRDLFQSSGGWKYPSAGKNNGEMMFQMSTGEQQLVIANDRVLALQMSGAVQAVRAYDLRTGKPITTRDPQNKKDIEVSYPTNGGVDRNGQQQAYTIQTVGSMFYIVGPKSMAAYDLDRDSKWVAEPRAEPGQTRDFILTQDYALMLNQVAVVNPKATTLPALKLVAYSRAKVGDGVESGRLVARPVIKDRIAAGKWQVTNGAFYYVSADNKLKMLKSSTGSAPTTAPAVEKE